MCLTSREGIYFAPFRFVKVRHWRSKHATRDQTAAGFSSHPQLAKLLDLHGVSGTNFVKDAISLCKQEGLKKENQKEDKSTCHHADLNHKLSVTLSDKYYLGKQLIYFM